MGVGLLHYLWLKNCYIYGLSFIAFMVDRYYIYGWYYTYG